MTKKTFSTDGLFWAQYTFLVAGGELLEQMLIMSIIDALASDGDDDALEGAWADDDALEGA